MLQVLVAADSGVGGHDAVGGANRVHSARVHEDTSPPCRPFRLVILEAQPPVLVLVRCVLLLAEVHVEVYVARRVLHLIKIEFRH